MADGRTESEPYWTGFHRRLHLSQGVKASKEIAKTQREIKDLHLIPAKS